MSTPTTAALRLRAEFRHPLSAADTDAITALRASACARGYAVAVIHASWRGTTHFLAVAPERCATSRAESGANAPAARGGSAQQQDVVTTVSGTERPQYQENDRCPQRT